MFLLALQCHPTESGEGVVEVMGTFKHSHGGSVLRWQACFTVFRTFGFDSQETTSKLGLDTLSTASKDARFLPHLKQK